MSNHFVQVLGFISHHSLKGLVSSTVHFWFLSYTTFSPLVPSSSQHFRERVRERERERERGCVQHVCVCVCVCVKNR